MKTRELTNELARLLSDRKARDITIIDIAEKSSFADYFLNATAGSERQLNALSDDVQDKMAELGYIPKSYEGRAESGWILIDGGDVIVNLFTESVRDKYSLDRIWADCSIEKFEE